MGGWKEISDEVRACERKDAVDFVRRKYLQKLHVENKRNVVAYYSAWVQKQGAKGVGIEDADMNAFMSCLHGLDFKLGLDLILHTPGGDVAAVEALIEYLHRKFKGDIVAYIPQLAMSGGTMMACACKEIYLGDHSNLGPIDPQLNGIPATSVQHEFERAISEVKQDKSRAEIWRMIIGRYPPGFVGDCENAIKWSHAIAARWLKECMFSSDEDGETKANRVATALQNRNERFNHARKIGPEECARIGLKIQKLESNDRLQDLILSIHHAFILSLSQPSIVKIVENHDGKTYATSS